MNKKNLLETAKELLKAAQDKPEQFQAIKKDDMPHAPNSPEDKAHDVSEDNDSIQHALKILDTPEKQKAMFEHLRTLIGADQQRSEANQQAGETADEQPVMEKSEIIKLAKSLIKAAQDPKQFEEMKKSLTAAPAPKMAAPKMAAPKQAVPAMPKAPKVGKPMTKDEIKADMASDWKPKFRKEKC